MVDQASLSGAEVQEEVLWMGEAAHVPVIGVCSNVRPASDGEADEVGSALAGRDHRRDAAPAECVMFHEGPHILEALDDVLPRMWAHQTKTRSVLRQLRLADLSR